MISCTLSNCVQISAPGEQEAVRCLHRTENPILKCGFALEMNKPLTECEKSFPLRCGPSMYPRTERRAVTIHLPLTLMEVLLQGFLVS